jgi:PBSX family phage terminase large subunit
MQFVPFSKKQLQVLTWWMPDVSPYANYSGIIADGSIRSGKTLSFSLSYVLWAMSSFNNEKFSFCSKAVGVFRRNIWMDLKPSIVNRGFTVDEKHAENLIAISQGNVQNSFYIFGGKDERSQDFIQGITTAGALFDEVALMPESFVNQATGRCSVPGAKLWFNCNPEHPQHYFKKEWLDKCDAKKFLHLHFVMDDNPSLTQERKHFYQTMYAGVFYQRFIEGKWVVAEGAIYRDAWCGDLLFDDGQETKDFVDRYISVDYGTTNPCVFLDILDDGDTAWQMDEYYWDSRKEMRQKTDAEYADDFEAFVGKGQDVTAIVDPSAASFKAELRSRGITVIDADNDVNDGIRMTSTMFKRRKYRVNRKCKMTQEEIPGYQWNKKAAEERGKEEPIKENDHAPDAVRYFVKTIVMAWRLAA